MARGTTMITPNNAKRSNSKSKIRFFIYCTPLYISYLISFLSVRLASNAPHRRYSGSLLSPGTLTAHERISLVLLHSCPDTVQRFPLRKTKASTPLTKGSSTRKHPRQDITPAIADCRFRAPLTPRLYGLA